MPPTKPAPAPNPASTDVPVEPTAAVAPVAAPTVPTSLPMSNGVVSLTVEVEPPVASKIVSSSPSKSITVSGVGR